MTVPYRIAIVAAAERHGLDPDLVSALVLVESAGEPWAWNAEPRYRYLWDVRRRRPFRTLTAAEMTSEVPPSDFPTLAGDRDQEWWAQQASWGLCQVMGAVAREHGYREPYLTRLCEVTTGLHYGCLALAQRLAWAKGDTRAALASYNGGMTRDNAPGVEPKRNERYVQKVVKQLVTLQATEGTRVT